MRHYRYANIKLSATSGFKLHRCAKFKTSHHKVQYDLNFQTLKNEKIEKHPEFSAKRKVSKGALFMA